MKITSTILALIMALNIPLLGIGSAMEMKSGTLPTSEVWSGEIKITGDVTVPKGSTLTIEPGTVFITDENAQTQPKLQIFGTLKVGQLETGDTKLDLAALDGRTKIIRVTPYEIDTKILRDEFHVFRTQYIFLWSILSAGLIYAIAHR